MSIILDQISLSSDNNRSLETSNNVSNQAVGSFGTSSPNESNISTPNISDTQKVKEQVESEKSEKPAKIMNQKITEL